ncbi:MAG: NDP-sugar synthase [Acidobacteriota bacterium]
MTQRTSSVTGIILAGTYPWNNSAFARVVPRPLLPIAHRPLMSYAVSWLYAAGIRDAAVCGRNEMPALQAIIAPHSPHDMQLAYYEDASPRGTAGTVCDATAASDSDTFVVAEGTAIPNLSLAELLSAHQASGALVTVVVHDDRRPNGPAGLQVPTGIYVISRRALEQVPSSGFYDLKETLIPQLYRAGQHVGAYGVAEASIRVQDWDTYLAVNAWMVERLAAGAVPPVEYHRSGASLIHRTASVAADAILLGPVMVAPGARIGSRAIVVGPCSIGADARLEDGVMVSRSAIWRRAVVRQGARTDRTIVCDGVVVDADSRNDRAVLAVEGRGVTPGVAPLAAQLSARSAPQLWRRVARALLNTDGAEAPQAQ